MTPPVGLNVFVVSRYARRPLQEIFAGVWPHVFSHLLLLAVLIAFPSIILWLPGADGALDQLPAHPIHSRKAPA